MIPMLEVEDLGGMIPRYDEDNDTLTSRSSMQYLTYSYTLKLWYTMIWMTMLEMTIFMNVMRV
jgi:hypothetical protein